MLLTGKESGYTLLEILIVVVLISIILGISLPVMDNFMDSMEKRAEQRKVIQLLSKARNRAIISNSQQDVIVDGDTFSYQLSGDELIKYQLEFISNTESGVNRVLSFYPDGTSSGNSLIFQGANGSRYSLQIDLVSGQASWREC